jgi:hypothetical protein
MHDIPFAIFPYRHKGVWAFDDERRGLVAEELIEGADTLLDRIVAPWEGDGRIVTKVGVRFWDSRRTPYILRRVGSRNGGTDYVVDSGFESHGLDGHKVWLCSALECYFAAPPAVLSISVAPLAYGSAAASP